MKIKMLWVAGMLTFLVLSAQTVSSLSIDSNHANSVNSVADDQQVRVQATPYVPPVKQETHTIEKDGRTHVVHTFIPDDADLVPLLPHAIGVPAIEARLSSPETSDAAFAETDVQQYHELRQSQGHGAGHFVSKSPVEIENIEFATNAAFEGRDSTLDSFLGDMNLPDNQLLCVVQYSGAFAPRQPGGMQQSTSVTLPYVLEVFDARTGNRLMSSIMSTLRP